MDITDPKSAAAKTRHRMVSAVDHVRHELASVRTGRASIGILDAVRVEAYGSELPLNQVASLSVPEPTLIVATPFDPSQIAAIEKAIRKASPWIEPQQTMARSFAFPCHRSLRSDGRNSRGWFTSSPRMGVIASARFDVTPTVRLGSC